MSRNPGYIVTFTNSEGQQKTGHVYHRDQTPAAREQNKVVVREVDGNGNPVKSRGREVVYIRMKEEVKTIGYID